ncbi:MAG TPA: hypothetical protein DCW29_12945, partial [Janthinobacterium sp.]|nr:hypothetical protein [Janthinobacterium sp.]
TPTGLTADIGRAVIGAVTGIVANNKVYDGTLVASLNTDGASFVGKIGADSLALVGASGGFADKNAGVGKTVAIAGIALAGADAGNYTLASDVASTTADIAAARLNVLASGVNKVYDGATGATVILADNRIAGDALTLASGGANFADKNAGAGKAVSVSGIVVGGADAGNYIAN